ncbi:MAG: peptide chain release factor N(5)-glutamine methyltransferase [Desulfovibrionaceae bacterium]
MPNPTLREICITAGYTLAQAGVDAPALSVRVLVGYALGLSRLEMTMQPEREMTPDEQKTLHKLIHRRAAGEPVALIVGRKEFYGRDFIVTPDTLVPRPDTECLIDYLLTQTPLAANKTQCFADLGTGSGCIAVTLCCERPRWQGVMVDISAGALGVAARNATTLGVANNLLPLHADMTKLCFKNDQFDFVISNPPYVSEREYHTLSKEIRDFEPRSALQPVPFGVGKSFELTGVEHIRALAQHAHRTIKPGGCIVIEHGYQQGFIVRELFAHSPYWQDLQTHQDLAARDRFFTARKALI